MRDTAILVFTLLAIAGHTPSLADTDIDYGVGRGRSSNIFQDASALSAPFSEANLALRGSLDLEDSHLSYALAAGARRVPRYGFADRRTAGVELGYTRALSDAVKLALKGSVEHRRDGDIFLALPGATIGYRKTDIAAVGSVGLLAGHAGGKSHLTAGLATIGRGDAHFTLPGLRPARLEADQHLFELTGGHIRPLPGGEGGVTVQYRRSRVAAREQRAFDRFPAETLRGSLAWGGTWGSAVTILAEGGLTGVESPHLGRTVRRLRPFLNGEVAWATPHGLLKAKLARDIRLADIDDALGEDVRTLGLSLERPLTERLKLALAYEQAHSDWLYYDYRTRTKTLSATLTFALTDRSALVTEYARLIRRESDRAAGFESDSLAARIRGTF